MIRKQLYISEAHERRLRELAANWQCSEAEVVRRAIDQLQVPEKSANDRMVDRLRSAGMLAEPRDDPDLPKGEAGRRFQEDLELRISSRKEAIGLSQAVLEDRR